MSSQFIGLDSINHNLTVKNIAALLIYKFRYFFIEDEEIEEPISIIIGEGKMDPTLHFSYLITEVKY